MIRKIVQCGKEEMAALAIAHCYSALALVVSKIKVGPRAKMVGFRPLVYF